MKWATTKRQKGINNDHLDMRKLIEMSRIISAFNDLEKACLSVNADHRETIEKFGDERFDLLTRLEQEIKKTKLK